MELKCMKSLHSVRANVLLPVCAQFGLWNYRYCAQRSSISWLFLFLYICLL